MRVPIAILYFVPTLRDGSVIPHHLGAFRTATAPGGLSYGNLALRVGEVVGVVYRDDSRSATKRFTEYRVLVQHRDGSAPGSAIVYGHCTVASDFGGAADGGTHTLRVRSSTPADSSAPGDGSQVLIACVNGDVNSAVILAGVRGASTDPDPGADAGHRLGREFNGVRLEVDKSGSCALTVRGATGNDGELAPGVDPGLGGAALELKSTGDARLGHGDQVFEVLHGVKKARVAGTGGVDVDAGKSDAVVTAGRVKIGGPGASEALVKGTTQRRAEADRDRDVISALGTAGAAASSLVSAVTAASAQLTAVAAAHAVPVTGPVTGAVALAGAAATIASMAPALAQLAQSLGQVASAFAQYEARGAEYLSSKNATDG